MNTRNLFLIVALLVVAPARAETLEDAWRMAAGRDAGLAAVRSRTEADVPANRRLARSAGRSSRSMAATSASMTPCLQLSVAAATSSRRNWSV
jgi:hypothetical protein